jgi:hypothetical protein
MPSPHFNGFFLLLVPISLITYSLWRYKSIWFAKGGAGSWWNWLFFLHGCHNQVGMPRHKIRKYDIIEKQDVLYIPDIKKKSFFLACGVIWRLYGEHHRYRAELHPRLLRHHLHWHNDDMGVFHLELWVCGSSCSISLMCYDVVIICLVWSYM